MVLAVRIVAGEASVGWVTVACTEAAMRTATEAGTVGVAVVAPLDLAVVD